VTSNVKVDVIIPNYNQTVLLSRAVDSALRQGGVVNKVIIVDDGSDENVVEYLNSNYSGSSNVQVLFSTRKNHPGAMREIGINHSTSDWIAFLDADDFWEQDKLKKQIAFALQNNFQVVCCDGYLYRNFVKIKRIYQFEREPKINIRTLIKENFVINSSALARRECFKKIGGYPEDYHLRGVEDFSTWLRLSIYFRIGFLNEALVNYEDLGDSFSKQQNAGLRNFAIFDFIFWSNHRAPLLVRLYLKLYAYKVIRRA